MSSFFKTKVNRKIFLGYLAACVLMIGVGALALERIKEINQRVDHLTRNLSPEMSLSKDIALKASLAHVYADAYVNHHDQRQLNEFIRNYKELSGLLEDLRGRRGAGPGFVALQGIEEAVDQYGLAYEKIVRKNRHRQDLVSNELAAGQFYVEGKLSAIRMAVSSHGEASLFLSLANAQDSFFKMLLNGTKYFQTGDQRYVVLFQKAFDEAEKAFSHLGRALDAPLEQKNVTEARLAVVDYARTFTEIRNVSREINLMLQGTVHPLEGQIGVGVHEIVADIQAQHERHHQESLSLLNQTRRDLVLALALSVSVCIFLSLLVSRRITTPLHKVMAASRQIANEDLKALSEQLDSLSRGDLRLGLQVSARPLNIELQDEVGRMARAFDDIVHRLHEAEGAFAAMAAYLKRVAETAASVANGDLTVRLEPMSRHDELGRAIAMMLQHLRRADEEVKSQRSRLESLVAQRTGELEESRRSLSTLLSNLPGMAYRCQNDPLWTMEFVSDGVLALTGYRAEDLIANHALAYADIIHPEDRRDVREIILSALKDRSPFTLLYRIVTRDGLQKWVWEKGQGIFTDSGQLSALEGFIADITDRKKTEEALQFSEERFRLAFNLGPDAIAINRMKDGLYVDINEGFSRVLGYAREEVLGKTSLELGIWDDLKDRSRLVEGLTSSGAVSNLEGTFRKKDGTLAVALMSARIISFHGEPHILSVTRDISEIKKAEAEKADLQARLQQARKLESIGTLAGGIAHEFNNLLGIILGNVELLLFDGSMPPQNARCLEAIRTASLRGRDVVLQLLNFSRKSEEVRRPILIAAAIADSLKLLRSTIPSSIEIRETLSDHTAVVLADATQIHQIVINLCANSADAMRDNGGQVTLSLERVCLEPGDPALDPRMNPGDYVKLSLADTGHGISASELGRIFDPFFTTKPVGKGTGLGLAVVHGIVKGHGGSIRVTSEPSVGTTFHIHFPVMEEEMVAIPEACGMAMPSGREVILLVDDEASLVQMQSLQLRRLGYCVLPFTEPGKALNAFRANPNGVDLVITDMTMPVMTGDQLIRAIREIRPNLPAIMCTGFSERIDSRASYEMGIRALFMKPVEMENLARTIRLILDEEAAGGRVSR